MRQLVFVFAIGATILCAQQPPAGGRGGGAPHKNLQVLSEADMTAGAMRQATAGLGVMCTYCHADDRSSDEKPTKLTARKMFAMTKEINSKFPDGKVHVTCYTCHRGVEEPLTAPAAAQ